MKVATPFIVLAAVAYAQQDLSGVPACGRKCVESMFDKAKELGCSDDDIDCLCENADFGNGLHDCTVEACPQGQLQPVEDAAAKMCPGGPSDGSGDSSSSAGGDEPTPSLTDSVIPSESATDGTGAPTGTGAEPTGTGAEPTATGGDSTETGGAPASTPYTTKPVVSTVTEDGKPKETTVGSTTLFTKAAGGSGSNTGTGAEPTKTGGDGNGNGSGSGGNETGGDGNGNGNGGKETGGKGSGGQGGGDATKPGSGAEPTETGAAAPLNVQAGGLAGALGLAALLVM